ncbi:isochorismatase family protein [Polynucleobacter sp. AP-Titi-500A-B4]|uniref:isochorismatase family protein n=1 Tax=Polynucleobacter sp. AP-Titi-500A-B4 TaxID=2576923 RepID=UPI001BFE919E|nr:isochorismatase family protein [Polynucleobacter sp. AP-Titi-500A-B4]QWE12880.1 isochorismatase family protein [Polynucleobacter sp. AP-Titi-500A-B4]
MINQATSILVLVDYQTRLMPSIHEGEGTIASALFLAKVAQVLEIPILGTEQNPEGLGPNDERIKQFCSQTLVKHSFNAAADGLVDSIKAINPKISQIVLAGCEAHVCLMQTALGLLDAGYELALVAEASGSRLPQDKQLALDRLARQGVALLGAEMLAFEWLKTSEHPQFKNILQLIKNRT